MWIHALGGAALVTTLALEKEVNTFFRLHSPTVTPDMRIKPDYRVAGRVKRLERLLGGGPARALVELELSLVRVSDGKLIVIDTYTVEKIGADATVEASVTAMSAAVADIFERFVGGAMSTQLSRAREE